MVPFNPFGIGPGVRPQDASSGPSCHSQNLPYVSSTAQGCTSRTQGSAWNSELHKRGMNNGLEEEPCAGGQRALERLPRPWSSGRGRLSSTPADPGLRRWAALRPPRGSGGAAWARPPARRETSAALRASASPRLRRLT